MAASRKCLSSGAESELAVAASLSVRQVLSCTGLVPAVGNYKTVQTQTRIQQPGLDTSHFTGFG